MNIKIATLILAVVLPKSFTAAIDTKVSNAKMNQKRITMAMARGSRMLPQHNREGGGVGGREPLPEQQEGEGEGGRPDNLGKHHQGGSDGDALLFPWSDIGIETTTITCDAIDDCQLPNGDAGVFICRERFHPVTGESGTNTKCIPNDQAWATDICGCCNNDECPSQPDYIDLTCDNSDLLDTFVQNNDQPTSGEEEDDEEEGIFDGRGGGPQFSFDDGEHLGAGKAKDLEVICRNLFNPFTGVETTATIPVRQSMGLSGDTCGCCNDICPEELGDIFVRPDFANKTCDAQDETLITCTIPPTKRGGEGSGGGHRAPPPNGNSMMTGAGNEEEGDVSGDGTDEEEEENGNIATLTTTTTPEEGVFVCRQRFDQITGESKSETICIEPENGFETDECGCCGDDCPPAPVQQEEPAFVDIDCSALDVEPTCQLRGHGGGGGEVGVFVCRTHFYPVDGSVLETSVCVPSSRAWATDVCGCCVSSGCPEVPAGGFDDADTQMVTSAALSVQESQAAANASGSSSPSVVVSSVFVSGLLLSMVTTIVF